MSDTFRTACSPIASDGYTRSGDEQREAIEEAGAAAQARSSIAGGRCPASTEVARRVGVSRQSVLRWDRVRQNEGVEGLLCPKRFGRQAQRGAAQGIGGGTQTGGAGGKIRDRVVDATVHWLADHTAIRSSIGTVLGVAHPRGAGLECAASGRTSAPARRALDSSLEDAEVAGVKKFQDANSATMTHPIRRRSRRRDLGSKSRRHCGTRNAR